MADNNKKKNIGNLGNTWAEKLRYIRSITKRNQKTTEEKPHDAPPAENNPNVPLDSELFAGPVYEELTTEQSQETTAKNAQEAPPAKNNLNVPSDSELFASPVYEELTTEQIFVGNEDFFKILEDAHNTEVSQYSDTKRKVSQHSDAKQEVTQPSDTKRIVSAPNEYKLFSIAQKGLAAAILLIAVALLYVKLKTFPIESFAGKPDNSIKQIAPANQQRPQIYRPVAQTIDVKPELPQESLSTLDETQPLSLKIAQNFYLNGNYEQALNVYEQLNQRLSGKSRENLMSDSLQLQAALCMEKIGDYEKANLLLRKIVKSESPAVRVVANYHRGLLEMQNRQYLNARTKAFQAIALIDTVDIGGDWAFSLKRNCYFLAAEAVTKKSLSLYDGDKEFPEKLWSQFDTANKPFVEFNETQLRTFINSGSKHLSEAILSPQIHQFDRQDGITRYAITCNGTSIEELLSRFASNAGIDLNWNLGKDEIGIRKQLVYLHIPAATEWELVTVVTGCSNLAARRDETGTIAISNPAIYSNTSDHKSVLSDEAVSLWQKFLLRFPEDSRLANIHFALGLLYEQKNIPTESIAEYKLTASRFPRSSLAPYALLNSGKLKMSIRNYSGGARDLQQLIEQYPDIEISEEASLYLADSTAKSGQTTEALRLFSKAFNLSLSDESKRTAALGAGYCSYKIEDFDTTAIWLTRYIELVNDTENKDLYTAYYLLGKSYIALGKHEAAYDAFKYALQGGASQLDMEQHIAAISNLVDLYLDQEKFIQILDLLESTNTSALSQNEAIELLLLKSKALRAMGLVDKAATVLRDKSKYLNDTQLKTKIEFELSRCYVQKNELELAQKTLVEILTFAESGALAHKVALKLGDICLKLGQNAQAISVCSQLLALQPSEQIKQETLELLAMAYNQQKNYDRAALALLGQWK